MQQIITRMTSCFSLPFKPTRKPHSRDSNIWLVAKGSPYLLRFHLTAIIKSRDFSLNKLLKHLLSFVATNACDVISSGCFYLKLFGTFPSEKEKRQLAHIHKIWDSLSSSNIMMYSSCFSRSWEWILRIPECSPEKSIRNYTFLFRDTQQLHSSATWESLLRIYDYY